MPSPHTTKSMAACRSSERNKYSAVTGPLLLFSSTSSKHSTSRRKTHQQENWCEEDRDEMWGLTWRLVSDVREESSELPLLHHIATDGAEALLLVQLGSGDEAFVGPEALRMRHSVVAVVEHTLEHVHGEDLLHRLVTSLQHVLGACGSFNLGNHCP